MKCIIPRITLIFILLFITPSLLKAQNDSFPTKIYQVYPKYELPAAGVGFVLSYLGFKQLAKTAALTPEQVNAQNPDKINAFDRPIIFKNPANFKSSEKVSDRLLNLSIIAPAFLLFDKKISQNKLDLLSMYLITHSFNNGLYLMSTFSVRRPRPLTYSTGLTIEERTGEGKSNSFFSGHVAFAAASTFFMTKVYTDYHHIKGWKRVGLFAAAAIPPSLVGYYRIQAARHFKTDVLVGLLAGGASGILVPELHRITKQKGRISFAPYTIPGASGISVLAKL